MNSPLLSVVVLGYGNFDRLTLPCLESMIPLVDDPDIEVLVVDNGSVDGSAVKTAEWCRSHPRTKCLLLEPNRGYGGGINAGVAQARGSWLLLVSNDTIFPEFTLTALKRIIADAPPDVALLAPVTNAAGNGQRLWQPGIGHEEWLHIGAWLHEHPTHQLMPAYRCDFFCIAVRRDVWEQLGGMDMAFGKGYYEDFDFSLRVTKAGYRQMITEDVFILHTGSATFQHTKETRALIKRNKKVLRAKHPDARFEHTRLGNLAVLRAYQELKAAGAWTEALERRLQLRVGALTGDAPRSFFKKWLWKRKIKPLLT